MTITSNQGRDTGINWSYFSYKKKNRFVLFFFKEKDLHLSEIGKYRTNKLTIFES